VTRLKWTVAVALGAAGCSSPDPVRVGSKPFAENQILAELIAKLAVEEGLPVERHLDFGDTFACQDAITSGALDVYPEYTGTALAALGLPAQRDRDQAWTTLRDRTADLGLQWPVRLGFDNPYVVVTTPSVAARRGLRAVSDLVPEATSAAPVEPVAWTVAASAEFMERPVDGFDALGRHYGIVDWEAAVVSVDPAERFGALLGGRVDVAIADATSPWIDEYGLVVLDDDLSFFPAYEAAPVVRAATLAKHPVLGDALARLDGMLTRPMVRAANRAVEIDGRDPREVAERLGVDLGLLDEAVAADVQRLEVAVSPGGEAPRLVGLALKAVREASPGARVMTSPSADPAAALAGKDAWLAVVAAPTLFDEPGESGRAQPAGGVEALAALGHVAVHLVGRSGGPARLQDVRRVGVGAADSVAARLGRDLASAYGVPLELQSGERGPQLAALDAGELDAVLVVDEVGSAAATLALRADGRTLLPIDGWAESDRGFRYPYLRSWRIAPASYPGVSGVVPTVGAQLVLVAPRATRRQLGEGGPVGALEPSGSRPLTDGQRQRLQGLLSVVPLDPVVPRHRPPSRSPGPALPLQPAVTLANLATFGFLGFLLWVLARGTSRVE
jgi:glycine betaine/choline ABC-type transport system substrate-binding protein